MYDAVTAKFAVGKLAVQIEVTISWVRKEQSVLRHKLQLIQELGMSAYGGGQVNKPRIMLAEEGEYDEDGIYSTNDGERNAKSNGVRKDQKSNGGYNRGTTARFNRNIMFPCPCGGDHKTGWGSMATCGHFREQTVSERQKLVKKKRHLSQMSKVNAKNKT